MAVYEFEGKKPVISKHAFIHPDAVIIGAVTIEGEVFMGPGAVIRADFGSVLIKDGVSIQDNVVIHVDAGVHVVIENETIIGHGAILHDVVIGRGCIIGMGSVLLPGVSCGEGAVVAAGSMVPQGTHIPAGKLAAGNPAHIIKDVSPKLAARARTGSAAYRELTRRYRTSLKPCDKATE